MRKFTYLLLAAATLSQAGTLNLNTGQSPGSIGSFSDPVWTIASAPAGGGINTSGAAYILHNSYPPAYLTGLVWNPAGLPPTSVANFISAGDCGRENYTASCPTGDYSFETDFTITDPAAVLNFSVAGDNRVEVYLNGTFLYGQGDPGGSFTTGWASMSPLQTITGLAPGNYTLEMRVINASIFTGGILVGELTQADSEVPEPGTWTMAGLALTGLGVARRKRRRQA